MHSFLLWLLPTNHKVAIQPESMTNVYRKEKRLPANFGCCLKGEGVAAGGACCHVLRISIIPVQTGGVQHAHSSTRTAAEKKVLQSTYTNDDLRIIKPSPFATNKASHV